MSNSFEQLLREADKPTQVPEQLAKYVAALVNGTHEITSVAIRPKRASKPWVGLTDEEVLIMSRYDLEYAALIGEVQRKLKEKNSDF